MCICRLLTLSSVHDLVIRVRITNPCHGLLIRAHGLLSRAHDLLNRAHGLLNCAHGLLIRAHGLLNRAHDLASRAHGLLSRVHGLARLIIIFRMSPPGLHSFRRRSTARSGLFIWTVGLGYRLL